MFVSDWTSQNDRMSSSAPWNETPYWQQYLHCACGWYGYAEDLWDDKCPECNEEVG